jgi:O-antigen/teichoic acid export membrane protein
VIVRLERKLRLAAADARSRRMLATGSASSAVQLVSVAAGFVITPLLVRHLGAVQYGIYETIASTVAWVGLAHFGLGPSVLNELATARTLRSPERGAITVSSATAVQVAIAALLFVMIVATAPVVSWARIVNAPANMAAAASMAVIIMLVLSVLQLPFGLGSAVFEAHQRGYIAQGWQLTSLGLRLAAVVSAVALGGSLALVVLALTMPGLLVQVAQYIHAFYLSYPQLRPRATLVSWMEGRALLTVGADFFVLSIAALIITSTDNLVIAHVIAPSAVTPYAVTSKLTQVPTMITLLALQAAWPAYRETATTDVAWLRRTHRRMRLLGVAAPVLVGLTLLLAGRPFIQLWAGPDAVPSTGLLLWLIGIALIQGVLLPPGRLLTALGATRMNALVGAANAGINLPLSIVFAKRFGVAGVAMGTAVGYALTGALLLVASRRRLAHLED